jgi:hypothetical protein
MRGNSSLINPSSKISVSEDPMGEIVVVDDDDTLNQEYLREQTEANLM